MIINFRQSRYIKGRNYTNPSVFVTFVHQFSLRTSMNKFCFSVIAILFASRLFAQAEPANYANAALEFKIFYNTNHIDSIFNRFSPELKKALPEDRFIPTTSQLKKEIGNLQQTEFVKIENGVAV